ncbi:MAG: PIN domain-containing protein, partial [Limisphaerales bacterium]
VVIPYFKGDKSIQEKLRNYGSFLLANAAKTRGEIQNFLAAVVVLSPGIVMAEHYGSIRAVLAKAGTPIPENDIWISALAIEHNLPLIARDAHFDKVAGLQILKR